MSRSRDTAGLKIQAVTLILQGHGVHAAIKQTGLSRSTVYRALESYGSEGIDGLKQRAQVPRIRNRISENTVNAIMEITRRFPTYSYPRIADQLRRKGLQISNSGVQKIWGRLGLTNRDTRLRWAGRQE